MHTALADSKLAASILAESIQETVGTTADHDQLTSRLVEMLDKHPESFTGESLELVNRMVNYATRAEQIIERQSERIDQLEALSVTDSLTGLLNRRGFEDSLRLVLSNARRYLENGMLAYIDLDNFKDINDQYGHDVGDEVLKQVAMKLSNSCRRTDYVARIGGDEFTILFVRAEQIPTRARAVEVRSALNPLTVQVGQLRLDVHASVGLEQYGPTTTSKELLRRSDRSMYKDKSRKKAA